MIRHLAPSALAVVLFSACGGSKGEAEAPLPSSEQTSTADSDSEQAESAQAADEGPANGPWTIPKTCHSGDSPCTANPKWVKKLCQDVYPGVAVYLFAKQSPFTRGYLSRKTKAVNASGGATSGDEWLAFDEEVVLLHYQAADNGGMQVSGASGGYDAMRLDGSCVTLGSDEVRLEQPPTPKYAKVAWRFMGEDMQDAVRKDEGVKAAYIERRKECQGAYSGAVSQKCVTRDDALNTAIIKALTSGALSLPEPLERP